MYSLLPALFSLLVLFFGLFVVHQKGLNRVNTNFLVLCVITFFLQFTWAALFQASDPETANQLIKMSWFLILVLPTILYQFVCEITGVRSDFKFIFPSYLISLVLAAIMIATNHVVDGYYQYFWGYYPRAGDLHFVHIVQTAIIFIRTIYITYKRMLATRGDERIRITYCLVGLISYCLMAIDYLCNYGFEFYPPGVLFIAVGLGIIAIVLTRYQTLDSARAIAASVAHEMRTPMATIKLHTQVLAAYLPVLIEAYQQAAKYKLVKDHLDEKTIIAISDISKNIQTETIRSSQAIDMLLAMTSNNRLNHKEFKVFSASACIQEAIDKYPFEGDFKELIRFNVEKNFYIFGSDTFFTFVIFNLIKNSLYAIKEKGDGAIIITVNYGAVSVKDTGQGIQASVLPHVFEDFYTTKSRSSNAGVGLSFCKRVVESFGGKITCNSQFGVGTHFKMAFYQNHHSKKRANMRGVAPSEPELR